MIKKRPIIEIDEELCNGCGQCILNCAEGALELVGGKARLVGEILCDGLGACIGECPTGALTVVERESEEFDEEAVHEHLKTFDKHAALRGNDKAAGPKEGAPAMACGCPGSMARSIDTAGQAEQTRGGHGGTGASRPSELSHWPVKLQLLGPGADFLKGSDLLLLADCAAVSHPELHRDLLRGHAIATGCPKLDDLEAHIQRLAEILEGARPESLTVAHMEVPCCRGFVYAAEEAIKRSGIDIPLGRIKVGIQGEVLEEEDMTAEETAEARRA